MREILCSGFAELGVAASEEALAALERYAALLEEKNKVMNLTAIKGAEDVARLHFLDCGALLRYIRPEATPPQSCMSRRREHGEQSGSLPCRLSPA